MSSRNNRNRIEIPEANEMMEKLKMETASELGIMNYDTIDKGDLPSRVNGKIGGNMVRKMIKFAQISMKDNPQAFQSILQQQGANQNDIAETQQYMNKQQFS